jgi:urea transport system ATP-binding protein
VAVLELNNLNKKFSGVHAVRDFSFSMETGSLHALIGPNGCGKSTLFNLISGALKPDSGEVHFDSLNITGLPPHKIARKGIGRKFQIPSVFETLTVLENLDISQRRAESNLDFEKLLALAYLTDRRDQIAGELAHGQKQWLEIAMLLAQSPRLILLDEPAAGMTQPETKATADLVRKIHFQEISSIIVIEHDMGFIEHLECPVHVMSQGQILKSGTYATLKIDEEVRELYFGKSEKILEAGEQ